MIHCDIHEKDSKIPMWLEASGETVTCDAFNTQGHSDYWWVQYPLDAHITTEIERKQWSEVLGSPDRVEEQLFKHLLQRPTSKHVLLIEGLAVPAANGISVLRSTSKYNVYVRGWSSPRRMKSIHAWLYAIGKYIEIIRTVDPEDTAMALIAMYQYDQKDDHKTFKRNYARVTYHPNIQVSMLIGMYPGIGVKKAEVLIDEFGTVWNLLNATPEKLQAVAGIGPVLAHRLLRQAGRMDISRRR